MFSRPVRHVAGTRIFARPFPDGTQALIYSMNLEIDEDLAMLLPLPVPPKPPEDAIQFVDLSRYPKLFTDFDRAFPAPVTRGHSRFLASRAPEIPKLKVHTVGAFDASFVPSQADFARVDDRFRLDPDVYHALPEYADFGFAVFKLRPLKRWFFGSFRRQTVHPMAFVFPRRDPTTLFFPTVHVHDGIVHREATFDHQLYCQPDEVTANTFAWRRSEDHIGRFVDTRRTANLVNPDTPAFKYNLIGQHPNLDVTLTPPGITLEKLRRTGKHYFLKGQALAAYYTLPEGRAARWQRVARHQLPSVLDALAMALNELTRMRAHAWELGDYDVGLAEYISSWLGRADGRGEHILVGRETGLPFDPHYVPPSGPGCVQFAIRDDERIEPQQVLLAFEQLPDSNGIKEIQQSLNATLASIELDK